MKAAEKLRSMTPQLRAKVKAERAKKRRENARIREARIIYQSYRQDLAAEWRRDGLTYFDIGIILGISTSTAYEFARDGLWRLQCEEERRRLELKEINAQDKAKREQEEAREARKQERIKRYIENTERPIIEYEERRARGDVRTPEEQADYEALTAWAEKYKERLARNRS